MTSPSFNSAGLGACCRQANSSLCDPSCSGVQVGWRHQENVKELEEKRKTVSAKYYEQKKKLRALQARAAAKVDSQE